MPTGDLRRKLRAHGHALKPLVHIGKGGVTKGVLGQLAQALFDHELVKVRIASECPVDRFTVADALAEEPGTSVVQLLGRVVLVYKRHPLKPQYEGKVARGEPAEEPAKPTRRRSKAPRRRTKRPEKK
jgi:RNA-binding protein